MSGKSEGGIKVSWWYISFGAAVLLLLWSLAPFLIQLVYRVDTLSEAGTVGDSYGAFNALISSGAMIALVVSIYLQRMDLKTQGNMLEAQKEEMAATAKALEEQVSIASMAAYLQTIPEIKRLCIGNINETTGIGIADFENNEIGYELIDGKIDQWKCELVDQICDHDDEVLRGARRKQIEKSYFEAKLSLAELKRMHKLRRAYCSILVEKSGQDVEVGMRLI